MFRRAAAAVALTAAGLLAAAPLAQAEPGPAADPSPTLLDDLTVLPVQACGLQVPILGTILGAPDSAPDAVCSIVDDGGGAPATP